MSKPNLQTLLTYPGVHLAPSTTDALTARLIAEAGFEIAYMGGNATTASYLGVPDVGLITLTEMASQAARICDAASLPLIVDADTGYGNALNVQRAVKAFENAGAAALHLEDQTYPKRCGHFAGKQLVPVEEMIGKIKSALDSRNNKSLLIIARTDAIAVDGFEAAYERLDRYKETGADIVMFGPPCKKEHLNKASQLKIPMACVIDTTGNTPISADGLDNYGVRIGLLPTVVPMSVIFNVRKSLESILATKGLDAIKDNLASFEEYNSVLGLSDIKDLEDRYSVEPE